MAGAQWITVGLCGLGGVLIGLFGGLRTDLKERWETERVDQQHSYSVRVIKASDGGVFHVYDGPNGVCVLEKIPADKLPD